MGGRGTSKKKGPKHLHRLKVAEEFISACVSLSECDKAYVEQFLALSAYGDGRMDHYTPRSKRHRMESEYPLCGSETNPVQQAWSQWAKMVQKANLWEFERIEAVREMLGALIAQKNKNSLTESELRVAAEKALEWTQWDENNLAMARLLNSPKFKSWLKAVVWEDPKEAINQYAALVNKASA